MSKSRPRKRPDKKSGISRHAHRRLHDILNMAMRAAKLGQGELMKRRIKAARTIYPHLPSGKLSRILDTYSSVVSTQEVTE